MPRLSLPEVLRSVTARLARMLYNVGADVSRLSCSPMQYQQKESLQLQRAEHRLRQARCLLDKPPLSALRFGQLPIHAEPSGFDIYQIQRHTR